VTMKLFSVVVAHGILASAVENENIPRNSDLKTNSPDTTTYYWEPDSTFHDPVTYHEFTVDTSNATSGYMSTPHDCADYSLCYPFQTDWTWNLLVPAGKGVKIYFENFDMEQDYDGVKVCVDQAEYFFSGPTGHNGNNKVQKKLEVRNHLGIDEAPDFFIAYGFGREPPHPHEQT